MASSEQIASLKGINKFTKVVGTGRTSSVSVTRTADTSAYTANDVLGAATGTTAAIEFTGMGPVGSTIRISGSMFEVHDAAIISGQAGYRLWLYNITPPSALGDNVAFDVPSGDRASLLGFIDLGTVLDYGTTLIVQAEQTKDVKLVTSSLWAYPVTIGAYTPENATVHKITLSGFEL
jgi:hypothetical protein